MPHEVTAGIQLAAQIELGGLAAQNDSVIARRCSSSPQHSCSASRTGNRRDRQRLVRFDFHRQQVRIRMTTGAHQGRTGPSREGTGEDAGPEVESLADLGEIGTVEEQADPAEVQPVRVLAKPVEQLPLSLRAGGIATGRP